MIKSYRQESKNQDCSIFIENNIAYELYQYSKLNLRKSESHLKCNLNLADYQTQFN